jgi:Uma2 family endonuclease
MQLQLPIALSELYEPEPDASIIRGAPGDYRKRLAGPEDVSCVIEAAHSSLARDQETKLSAYAGAGIPQYIIFNLQSNKVEIYTDPDRATGTYRTGKATSPGDSVSLFLADDARLSVLVSDMLP